MKFRNLLAMLPLMAAYSCTFDESGLPGGRRPNLSNGGADGFVNPGGDGHTKDAKNPESRDAELDGKIIRKDGNIDSMVFRRDAGVPDAGYDLGLARDMSRPHEDAGRRDLGIDARYTPDADTPDLGHDMGLARDMSRRDGFTIFPDIIIRPFDLGSDARDAGLDLGADGLTRDLGLDGIVADAGRDLGPDGPVLPIPYECDANTVALYHFNQPEPFLDSCGTHNLTSSNVDIVENIESLGDAVSLGGSDSYLRTEDVNDLNFNRDDFTMELRFKLNAPPRGTLLSKLLQGGGYNGYRIDYVSPGGWMCGYEDSVEGRADYVYMGEGLIDHEFDPSLQDGRWHHLACARSTEGETTSIRGYVDGINVTTETFPSSLLISNRFPFLIGTMLSGGSRYRSAPEVDIDEVRISNIARTFE